MKKILTAVAALILLQACGEDRSKVKIQRTDWKKSGFGVVLMADFLIENGNSFAIKDIKVECIGYSSSNSRIDSNSRTIYQTIPANAIWEQGSAKWVVAFNMGFLHSQVEKIGCKITDYQKV
jgi:hypothetical protein